MVASVETNSSINSIVRQAAVAAIAPVLDPIIDEEIDAVMQPDTLQQIVESRVSDRVQARFSHLLQSGSQPAIEAASDAPGSYHAEEAILEVTAELEEAESPAEEAIADEPESAAPENSHAAENSAPEIPSEQNSAPEISLKIPTSIRRSVTKSQIQKNLLIAMPKSIDAQIAYLEAVTTRTPDGVAWLDKLLDAVAAVFGDRPSQTSYLNGARKLRERLKKSQAGSEAIASEPTGTSENGLEG